MSTVLIKDPSCDKEIIYLKLMSKANYYSRFGQGQRVPEQTAGKCSQPCHLASEPVSPRDMPVPLGPWITRSIANRLSDHGIWGSVARHEPSTSFCGLFFLSLVPVFVKIYSKTIKVWLFWGCGVFDPPITSTISFLTTPTQFLFSRTGNLRLVRHSHMVGFHRWELSVPFSAWSQSHVPPNATQAHLPGAHCRWPHLPMFMPLFGFLSCACTRRQILL